MPKITYLLDDGPVTIDAEPEETILIAAETRGIEIDAGCHHGHCGVCAIRVVDGMENLPPPRPGEEASLARVNAPSDARLACQAAVSGDVTVQPWDAFAEADSS